MQAGGNVAMRATSSVQRHARARRAAALLFAFVTVGALAQVGVSASTSGATLPADCSGETPPAKASGAAWSCMFDDEFSGSALGPAWVPTRTADTGVATGAGSYKGCYVNSTNNISLSKGVLRLTVRKEKSYLTCKTLSSSFSTRYTAGSVSTVGKFWQTYGRFSVRAKVPNTNVKGLQETLWLWPVNSAKYATTGPGWAEPTGEIDFAEMYSNVAYRNVLYLHYYYDPTTVNRTTGTNVFNAMPAPNNQPGTDCSID